MYKTRLIVPLFLFFSLFTTAAWSQGTATCNCASASLAGDTVGTQFTSNVVNKVVGSTVELPAAGPILGAAGSAPRWNIDFGNDSIRIDFVTLATYGGGAQFKFTSLDPKLTGCPPAYITGVTVTTNKPTTPLNVVTAVTFGQHNVTVPIAPAGSNLDWKPGEFILIKLRFGCDPPPPSVDPCCPPWNQTLLKNMMFYQGSGSIAAPYTLKFQPTTAFLNQMQAYINYLHSVNPAITAITIAFRLHNQGTGTLPITFWGPQIPPTAFVSWNWNTSGIGNPTISPATGFFVPPAYPPFPLQVGTWYAVQSGIYLENGQKFFPDKCAESTIYVRVQVMTAAKRRTLEFSDGKKIISTAPVQ